MPGQQDNKGLSQEGPSTSPLPLLTQMEEKSPLYRRAHGTTVLTLGCAAGTAAFAPRLWRIQGVRCRCAREVRAHGVIWHPSGPCVCLSLCITPCCGCTSLCTSACAKAVPRGAAGCPRSLSLHPVPGGV